MGLLANMRKGFKHTADYSKEQITPNSFVTLIPVPGAITFIAVVCKMDNKLGFRLCLHPKHEQPIPASNPISYQRQGPVLQRHFNAVIHVWAVQTCQTLQH